MSLNNESGGLVDGGDEGRGEVGAFAEVSLLLRRVIGASRRLLGVRPCRP